MSNRLSKDDIDRLIARKPGKTRKLNAGGGLWLQRTRTGSVSWLYRWHIAGHERNRGLGAYPRVPLRLARKLAAKASVRRAEGKDPTDRDKVAALTFAECE